jgi:lipopolysaccharide exporter
MSAARHRMFERTRQLATGRLASVAVGIGATNALRIVSSMTLTRLLDAHAYGIVGVIVSVSYMITMLSEVGMAAFIIRHEEGDDPVFRDQVWTIKVIRSFGLAAAMILIAHPIALFTHKPEVGPVLMVWSVSFLFDGFSSLAFATGIRDQKLWRMSMLDTGANVASLCISVGMALILRSYWAMVIGMLGASFVKMVLSYVLFGEGWRRWHVNRDRMREIWGFSRYIALSSALSLLILQADKVVLARLMPLSQYGLYAIAITLAAAPGLLGTRYAKQVLFGLYSKAARQQREGYKQIIYTVRRKVVLAHMFGVAFMAGSAALLIELLYDPRYRGVTPFLQLLLISTALRLPVNAANQALIALGHTRSTLYTNIVRIAWLAVGGALGFWRHDVMLIVATFGTVEVPGLLCFWFNLWRLDLLDLREEAYGLLAGGVGAALGFAVAGTALAVAPTI